MRTVSIRQSLLKNLVLTIVLMGAGISAIAVYGTRQLVSTLSGSIIVSTLDFTEARIRGFLDPVPAALNSARGWAEHGLLDGLDAESLDPLFKPLIAQFPQVASVRVADAAGREYLLIRRQGTFAVRESRADSWNDRVRWTETHDGGAVRRWEKSAYDPRREPWFKEAAGAAAGANDASHWSEPYRLPGGRPGITASTAANTGSGVRVIAFDIQLQSISEFTQTLEVSNRGGVLVLTSDRRIIGAPGRVLRGFGIDPQSVLLKRPDELGWALAVDAASALEQKAASVSPVRFKSGEDAYWGQARSISLSPDHTWFFAVVVPESDLLGSLPYLAVYVALIVVLVLLVAVLQAVRLSRRYSKPIEALVEESDRISRGELEDRGEVETSVLEVRQLAEAHDRMRSGLQSLMRLERDLDIARKIQQHTFPERLPDLPGFDFDAFSEPADQTGGDTYDIVARSPADTADLEDRRDTGAVLMLADVTGHGIGPALSAVQVRAMLRMALRVDADLSMMARHLNAQLASDLFGGRFITAWIGELNVKDQSLTYVSAGQGPLIHYHAAEQRFQFLNADAPPFGIDENLDIRAGPPLTLQPGDIFAVFSDGVFDSPGPDGGRFGEERVLAIIKEHRHESCGRILLELRKALAAFAAGTSPNDDRTAVIIKKT